MKRWRLITPPYLAQPAAPNALALPNGVGLGLIANGSNGARELGLL